MKLFSKSSRRGFFGRCGAAVLSAFVPARFLPAEDLTAGGLLAPPRLSPQQRRQVIRAIKKLYSKEVSYPMINVPATAAEKAAFEQHIRETRR